MRTRQWPPPTTVEVSYTHLATPQRNFPNTLIFNNNQNTSCTGTNPALPSCETEQLSEITL